MSRLTRLVHLPASWPLWVLAALISLPPCLAAEAAANGALQAGQAVIKKLIRTTGIPGLEVTVAEDGRIIWSRGYGYADLENHVPATPQTLMRIGSISKSLTATAIARAVVMGKINVDRSVRSYIPTLPAEYAPVTLRELGGHLGGVRTYYSKREETVYRHYDSVFQSLGRFVYDPLAARPGTKFLYTSYGFVLLSAAAVQATHLAFPKFLETYLLGPLNMSRTCPDDPGKVIEGRARQYDKDSRGRIVNAPFSDDSYKVAGSGMLSTSADLATLGNALVEHRLFRTPSLDARARALLFTSQKTLSGDSTGYGFGWFVNMGQFLDENRKQIPAALYEHLKAISSGRQLIWHSGTANGATAMLLLSPSTKVVVAIICNLGGIEPQLIVAAMEVEADLSRAHRSASPG